MLTNAEIEYFTRSKIALEILKELNKQEYMAKSLALKLKKHRETISRILIKFEKLKLAKCIKPNSSNFRPYKITSRGKEILKQILKTEKSLK